ncbi:MAG: hypothetical protein B6229_08920 [Spirochaetaceae bacterium 4572_7]|nr:MAG: hypothetical protein B6229_08920 [Spirochaetaceae bacterium 4572_7]
MDEILRFIGDAQKIIIETAKIQHSTFSEKEGKKESLIEVNYTQDGYLLSKKDKKSIENYIYIEKNLMSVHVSDLNNILLYKIEYDYEDGFLTKKSKTNNQGRVEEVESYINNDIGQIIEKISKTMRYQYEYLEDLLVEERWISDISLNQIIRFKYENRLLIEKQYFSGNEIPGRKIAYSRNKYGFITNEIVYSTSGEIISHIMYEYKTIFKDNWLKRVKNSLHNRKKEPIEVQYRDFKFFERISTKEDVESLEELIERPIEESIEETIYRFIFSKYDGWSRKINIYFWKGIRRYIC